MKALVFSSEQDALSQQSAVDLILGYPKYGVMVGEGLHVEPSESTTTTYAAVIKHPTQKLWAYFVDSVNLPLVSGTPQDLDDSWSGQ